MKTDAAWEKPRRDHPNDPYTRGIVVLGLEAPAEELAEGFAVAAATWSRASPSAAPSSPSRRRWLAGSIDDRRGGRPTWPRDYTTGISAATLGTTPGGAEAAERATMRRGSAP